MSEVMFILVFGALAVLGHRCNYLYREITNLKIKCKRQTELLHKINTKLHKERVQL